MRYFLLSFCLSVGITTVKAQTYFPPKFSETWETMDPIAYGFCQTNIDALYSYLATAETKSFILLKDGKILLEQYFDDGAIDKTWPWYSAGKSLSATLVGIAQEEGLLAITDKTSDYLGTGWTSLTLEQENKITIWHQLTMTTGMDETEFFCTDPECLTYVTDPETRWVYHNGPYTLLGAVVDSAYTGGNYQQFTTSRIKSKIGMSLLGAIWISIGYNKFFFSTARDMARFGLLIANDGVWDGTTVLGDVDYINAMHTPSQTLNPAYGYLWWLNGQTSFIGPDSPTSYPGPIGPNSPMDTYTAAGSQGQYISISPSNGYILIRQGTSSDESLAPINLLDNIWKQVLELPCAVTATSGYDDPDIRVYPNPVQGPALYVTGFDTFDYTIFTVDSKEVGRGTAAQVIDISRLSKGTYYVQLSSNGQSVLKKFVRL